MPDNAKLAFRSRGLIYGLASTLCVAAPFVVFLTANDYSILSAEVLPLHLVWLVAGALVGALAMLRLIFLARLALWGCLFLSIALLYDIESLWVAVAAAALSGAAIGALKDNAATVLLFAAALHIVSTIALGVQTDSSPDFRNEASSRSPNDLPPVVHLVLDEFTGLRGLPDELPEARAMRGSLADYYLEQGFDLATHAYSQYMLTANSLPNLFNFTSSAANTIHINGGDDAFGLTRNEYFKYLLERGYALHIRQSGYLDYCNTPDIPVTSCFTYNDNSIAAIADVDIANSEKSRFILNSYLDSSVFLRRARRVYLGIEERLEIDLPAWPTGNSRVGPLALLPTLDSLERELRELKPGEFRFAHLMIPHYPYVFSADCSVKPMIRTWLNIAPFELDDTSGDQNSDESRAERYSQYIAQIACTNRIVDDLLAAVRASGHWENSIIVIHGDHGSRIVRKRLTDTDPGALSDDDYRDAYSVFFAAKTAASSGRLMSRPESLQSLLADVWGIPFEQADGHHVYLKMEDGPGHVSAPLQGFDPIQVVREERHPDP